MAGGITIRSAEGYKGAMENQAELDWMKGVISLVDYMDKSRIWAENIVQMHVEENGDIVMIPREGKERFIFGSPYGAKDKFDRMSDYYRYILPEKGEGYYKTVNVKFDKQIVCKK
jgi:cell division protein FtsQ